MRQRTWTLVAVVALAIGAVGIGQVVAVDRTDGEQDAAIDRLNCEVFGEDCPVPHTPTATVTATSTATGTATATPTNTPPPTATATTDPGSTVSGWHAPTDHEHGDAPPQWAEDWSMATFGHGVIYGGDDATSAMENTMKHTAFKGYLLTGGSAEVYVRIHEASNAMDRQARWHSYEVYAKDATGAVSFWQGWLDRGDPATQRFNVCNGNLDASHPLLGQPHGWVMVGCAATEQWYTRGADWSWDIVTTIEDKTTSWLPSESMHDPVEAWTTTGSLGVHRNILARYYEDNPTKKYFSRNSPALRGWFCATPTGDITGSVSDPGECVAGTLPQYVAPTMRSYEPTFAVHRDYPSTGITLPN